MKKIYPILFIFLISCSSPEKLLQEGNYDALIDKAIKKILNGKKVAENSELLDKAYNLANQRDQDRVKYLLTEGNPNSWDEILSLYTRLKFRQENVRKVLPLHVKGNTINYPVIDYDNRIADSKRKAADYYYSHGKKLMENGDIFSYRTAYYELIKAKTYSGGAYSNIEQLISEARYNGISRVLVTAVNNTYVRLPNDFIQNLLSFNRHGLNSEWIEYHFSQPDKKFVYDYYIDIHLQRIDVSPGNIIEKDEEYKKTIQDGFNYVLDRKGNVMKDSAGNDIKVPKYKDLRCTVIEKIKEKSVSLTGVIEFSSSNPQSILAREPIASKTQFHDISYRAIGELDALTQEKRNMLQDREIPFPDDISMIYDAAEALKNSIADVIQHNRHYIK